MNRLTDEQVRRNRSREGEWELAASHRREVTRRIALLAAPEKRLCVLGAGNCNDLDLTVLADAYREVYLVDLDDEAMLRGVRRQSVEQRAGIYRHGGIDLTCVGQALANRWARADWRPPVDDDPLALAADPSPGGLTAGFEVVASVGILSQLIGGVAATVPDDVPWRWPLLFAVRTGHLRLCARLTAPGGHGLLVTDFVSSVTCPGLPEMADSELAPLAARCAAERNFFHGLNPLILPGVFQNDLVLRELVESVQPPDYWLWHQRARTYAVLAVSFRRRI